MPREADIDIAAGAARALMIIAVVVQTIPVMAEAERQRPLLQSAMNDARFWLVRSEVRQIHVPERARRPGLHEQVGQDLPHPKTSPVPVDLHAALTVVGECNTGPTVHG